MADSLFDSLLGMIDTHSVGRIAGSLGAPEESVSQGLKSSIAAVLGGMASKAEDPGTLRGILDIAPSALGDVNLSEIVQGASNPNSPLIAGGKRILTGLFGKSASDVTNAIGAASGLRAGTASTMLALVAPMVMSFLSRRVRTEGMTMDGLSSVLLRESGAIRNALPTPLRHLFWPEASTVGPVPPIVAQEVQKQRSTRWLPTLGIIALGLFSFWLLTHLHRPATEPVTSAPAGAANRVAVPCALPAGVKLPDGGVETQLLAFLQNSDAKPDATSSFNFDKLVFNTGSATLRPESQAQLTNIAAILTNCPSVHLVIAAYTDNVGSPESNLRLSRNRANTVVSQLVSKGVPPDHLTAEGHGQEYPVADNASEEGRAQNRRVVMLVTQK